ncbi:MAG TPA: TMEM175 family protein [Gaiellaceae bacterium]|nr:TMEM175 family protein [Gaiellaceae bacterium]
MPQRFETARLEAFSDGVFAIAITLLVLEISVPADQFDDLWNGIADQWPSYLAYVTSFWTIGGLWIVHHGIFRRTAYADLKVLLLNLLLLMAVSFLPFPTRLVAEAWDSSSAERPAVLFYGATLFLISAAMTTIARYIAGHPGFVREGVTKEELKAASSRSTPNLAFYGAVLVLAIVAPQVAAFGFLLIALAIPILAARAAPSAASES